MVESEELIFQTAQAVEAAGASVLRGGAFKPCRFHKFVLQRHAGWS